jgi:hypothetical protein
VCFISPLQCLALLLSPTERVHFIRSHHCHIFVFMFQGARAFKVFRCIVFHSFSPRTARVQFIYLHNSFFVVYLCFSASVCFISPLQCVLLNFSPIARVDFIYSHYSFILIFIFRCVRPFYFSTAMSLTASLRLPHWTCAFYSFPPLPYFVSIFQGARVFEVFHRNVFHCFFSPLNLCAFYLFIRPLFFVLFSFSACVCFIFSLQCLSRVLSPTARVHFIYSCDLEMTRKHFRCTCPALNCQ